MARKEVPVIQVYERPFEQNLHLSVGPVSSTLTGETFATHKSLLAALDHEAVPSRPSEYVQRLAESMGVSGQVDVSTLAGKVFRDILGEMVEFALDGTEVINLTKLSMLFGIRTREHPEVRVLDEVSQQRVLVGVVSFLAFIRDECTFEVLTKDGVKTDYVQ